MSVTLQKLKHTRSQALFAPVVDEFTVPDKDRLNRQLVEAIRNWQKEEAGITRSNMSGWHSDGNIFKRREAPFREVCKHFIDACKPGLERYFSNDVLRTKKLQLEGWVNINPQHAYNKIHTHDRFDLSGVYFAKIPAPSHDSSGALQFVNPTYRGGAPTELFMAMNPSFHTVIPSEGTMLIFPSSLPHWVLPNDEAEDRMSIAFNVRLNDAA